MKIKLMKGCLALVLFAAACGGDSGPAGKAGATLKAVQGRGTLNCGVNGQLAGFSFKDAAGAYTGFDVDFCRAIAAAIFGDSTKVTYVDLNADQRFTALANGQIDVLIRNTTWTLSRDIDLDLSFVQTTFYDGQGFLVRSSSGITNLMGLNGKKICVTQGTTTEINLLEKLGGLGISYSLVTSADTAALQSNYVNNACDAVTSDKSGLIGIRSSTGSPGEHMLLTETISKEPLGPVVRHGDDDWFDLVQWVVFATITGEELGVTTVNADDRRAGGTAPELQRLMGTQGELGTKLGLSKDWAYNILKQVGNYGEIYDRNLGPRTGTPIPRGANNIWTNGGLLYAPPMR